MHNRTIAQLHSWTLEHHSWLHQGAHKQSVWYSSLFSYSTYTRAVVVSYSEYVLVTQIPQKFDSHGSLQTHLVTGIVHRKMMMKVMAMTMFSSVWKVLSQQSRLGSSQQLLMVPIHLHLHNHTHLHPGTPTHSRTLTLMHTYTLTHTHTLTHMHINLSWLWKQHLLSHTNILIHFLNHTVCGHVAYIHTFTLIFL